MTLVVPSYIQRAGISSNIIRFRWDDWDCRLADIPLDDALLARLREISQRANVAVTIASGEWIFHRFDLLSDDPTPWRCAEAAWAQILDWRYAVDWEPEEEEWFGPVRGPLMMAMVWVVDAVEELEHDGDPAVSAACISKLATHVLPDDLPFRQWRELILARLETLYPLDPEERLGEVVPREALDPDFAFSLEMTKPLINRFLSGLSPEKNPLLNSSEEMLEEGFEGTPYVFDIEKDRQLRFEW